MKKTTLFFLVFVAHIYFSNAQWVQCGLSDKNVTTLTAYGSNIYAGTNDGLVYISSDSGKIWTSISNGIPAAANISSILVYGNYLFVGTNGDGVYLSTNKGTSWIAVNTGLTNNKIFTLDNYYSAIYAGTFEGGVFFTTNYGASWTALNNGLTTDYNKWISKIKINGKKIFAGCFRGLFSSTDYGTTWTATTFKDDQINGISKYGSNLYLGASTGAYISTDNGISWTLKYKYAVGDIIAYDKKIVMESNNDKYQNGVYMSTNDGDSWSIVNEGLPLEYTTVSIGHFAALGNYLYATTAHKTKKGVYLLKPENILGAVSTSTSTSTTTSSSTSAKYTYELDKFESSYGLSTYYYKVYNNGIYYDKFKVYYTTQPDYINSSEPAFYSCPVIGGIDCVNNEYFSSSTYTGGYTKKYPSIDALITAWAKAYFKAIYGN